MAEAFERFGAVPLSRVRFTPPPGLATEQDVIKIHDRENRLCELLDGTLVEKTVGNYESYLAGVLVRLLGAFVAEQNLGIILPPDGMLRLAPGLVRHPDVSFVSWQRLPARRVPHDAIWNLATDLATEIISKGNIREEMDRKLIDYFSAGVRLVWYIYPTACEVRESTRLRIRLSPSACRIRWTAATCLPGCRLPWKQSLPSRGKISESIGRGAGRGANGDVRQAR